MPRNSHRPPLDELASAVEVDRCGAISKAAVALDVSQPSLSATIAKLERRVGQALFVRTKRGVETTRAGRTLVARAKTMVREWDQVVHELRETGSELRGTYSIAVYAPLAVRTLPRFLPGLLQQHPKLVIDIRHAISREIASGVVAFEHDYGIVVNPPKHPELSIIDLYTDQVRLWRCASTQWDVRAPHVPVICSPQMPHVDAFIRQSNEAGYLPSCRLIHTTDLSVVCRLVAADAGVGILPTTIAQLEAPGQLTAARRLPSLKDKIALIWRNDSQTSAGSRMLRHAIRDGLRVRPGEGS